MDDAFDRSLPVEITRDCVRTGEEWIIPAKHVLRAIDVATAGLIAILGVELVRFAQSGFLVDPGAGYRFSSEPEWRDFVSRNNEAARNFVSENPRDAYILTAASQEEFEALQSGRGGG